jgi:imidazolonepropionase-like amidohydrolase
MSFLLPLAVAAAVITSADTTPYVVLNHGRPAGTMTVVRSGDSVVVRYFHIDRNRGQRVETRYSLGANGRVLGGDARPLPFDAPFEAPGDPPSERFDVAGDSVRWMLRGTRGAARIDGGSFYRLRTSGTAYDAALLAAYLLKQPQRSAKLLPTGTVRLEIAAETTVTTRTGRQHVRLAMLHGIGFGSTPVGVWLDDRDGLFAGEVSWFITVRAGAEGALPALRAKELPYRDRAGVELARRTTKPVTGPIAITNADLFDSERGVVRPRTTIIVRGDRIAQVGPSDSVTVPAGATVLDAAGKTVVPGLWDMHSHYLQSSQTTGAPLQLATGLTTVRDLAADVDVAVSHRDRAQAGTILAPHLVLAGFIEGPGAWAGPSEAIATTEAEARAWVARYDSLGYKQIKLYNLVQQDLVPAIAAEAHRRGMRLSGHIPRGLTLPAAVLLGFDEVNHAAFLFSTFYQDSLYVPRMRAYSAVAAAVAPNIDVDGAPMTSLIDFLKAHGTVVDGTFNLWMRGGSGSDAPEAQANDAHYLRLIKRLYDAGITLVPGTDNNTGSTYNTELELYERAGIPAPVVIQMATIVSARVMKDDRDYGSIVPGKVADLVIIDGKPAERTADLRKVSHVMRAGRVYTPGDLRAAVGLGGR